MGGAISGIILHSLGPGLTGAEPLGIGFLLLHASIGAVSGAILSVLASLFWNLIG